jgi:hypothetical protein
VSVRATILSLARFKIAEAQHTKVLERQWAVYREKNSCPDQQHPAPNGHSNHLGFFVKQLGILGMRRLSV